LWPGFFFPLLVRTGQVLKRGPFFPAGGEGELFFHQRSIPLPTPPSSPNFWIDGRLVKDLPFLSGDNPFPLSMLIRFHFSFRRVIVVIFSGLNLSFFS